MKVRAIRVLVVDDQALVRRGIAKLLDSEAEVEVVGEAEDGVDALEKVRRLRPEVVLVDARMPKMDGIELTQRLSGAHPEIATLVLTTFDDDEYIFGGLKAGAKGYLLKNTPPEELVAAIVKIRHGETVIGGQVAARVVSELKSGAEKRRSADEKAVLLAREAGLSAREVEVAALVGLGATNRNVARTLHVSEGTAKNHVWKILRKLGLKDRTKLALWASEQGLTESRLDHYPYQSRTL